MKTLKNYKKEIVLCLTLVLSCIIWIFGIYKSQIIETDYSNISLRLNSKPISVEEFNNIQEKVKQEKLEEKNVIGWFQKNDQNIVDEKNYSVKSNVIYSFGKLPYEIGISFDKTCAISYDKAYELWRSYDIEGKYIKVGDNTFKVTSILRDISNIIVVNANNIQELKYEKINVIEIEGSNDIFWSSINFENENLIESDIVINYENISNMLRKISIMPAYVMFLLIIIKLFVKIIENKKNILHVFIFTAICVIWININVKILKLTFDLPQNLIPTKWSDFNFWKNKINIFKEYIISLNMTKMYDIDIWIKSRAIIIILNSLVSTIIFLIVHKNLKLQNFDKLIVTEIIISFILFISFILIYKKCTSINLPIFYWGSFPLYICVNFILDNFKLKGCDADVFHNSEKYN